MLKNRMKKLLRMYVYIRAYCRVMIWGFCPHCNSSAPLLYDCPVCNYDTKNPFIMSKRKELWGKWKIMNKWQRT